MAHGSLWDLTALTDTTAIFGVHKVGFTEPAIGRILGITHGAPLNLARGLWVEIIQSCDTLNGIQQPTLLTLKSF